MCTISLTKDKQSCLFYIINTGLGQSFTHNFSLWIRRSIEDLIDLTYSNNVSSSTSYLLTQALMYYSTEYIIILKEWFHWILLKKLFILNYNLTKYVYALFWDQMTTFDLLSEDECGRVAHLELSFLVAWFWIKVYSISYRTTLRKVCLNWILL